MKEHNQLLTINLHNPRRVICNLSPIFPTLLDAIVLSSRLLSLEKNKSPHNKSTSVDREAWFTSLLTQKLLKLQRKQQAPQAEGPPSGRWRRWTAAAARAALPALWLATTVATMAAIRQA